jgi:hypothetical protein
MVSGMELTLVVVASQPWKAPPPVTFSTEYWREWQKKVKVDKASYNPEEKERMHREAERER